MGTAGRALSRSGTVAFEIALPPRVHANVLPAEFYQRQTLKVAPELLGKYFVHDAGGVIMGGFIVEVEAYHQLGDEAAHTFIGQTPRNAVMFGPGGHLYVYFTYGMHYCMNVVTESPGIGAAVLIRALEPVEGIDAMQARRINARNLRELTNGPAKCCQALGIDRGMNGLSVVNSSVRIFDAKGIPARHIERSCRIGIKKSIELDWRFTVKDNYFLSRNAGNFKLNT